MISRRQFMQLTGAGAVGLLTGGITSLANIERIHAAANQNNKFIPDLEIALKATPDEIPILTGNPTSVWRYQGQVL